MNHRIRCTYRNLVSDYSVKTLQDIIDHVGTLIKSHLHYLIPKILENASEIDVSEINKYTVRFAEDAQTTEKLENFKEQVVSLHFSTTTIRGVGRMKMRILKKNIDDEIIINLTFFCFFFSPLLYEVYSIYRRRRDRETFTKIVGIIEG